MAPQIICSYFSKILNRPQHMFWKLDTCNRYNFCRYSLMPKSYLFLYRIHTLRDPRLLLNWFFFFFGITALFWRLYNTIILRHVIHNWIIWRFDAQRTVICAANRKTHSVWSGCNLINQWTVWFSQYFILQRTVYIYIFIRQNMV